MQIRNLVTSFASSTVIRDGDIFSNPSGQAIIVHRKNVELTNS